MKHDARTVANSLIEKGRNAGAPLTPLQSDEFCADVTLAEVAMLAPL